MKSKLLKLSVFIIVFFFSVDGFAINSTFSKYKINENLATVTISYNSQMCQSSTQELVTLTGTTGGTFSSTAGLTINATTGTINPSTSVAGTYTVMYAVTGFTATTAVTIIALPIIDTVPNVTACNSYTLPPLLNGNYYTGPWGTGTLLNTGDVISVTQVIYIYASNNGCSNQTQFQITISNSTINNIPSDFITCDNDGVNDGYTTLDLTTYVNTILGPYQTYPNYSVNFYDSYPNGSTTPITNVSTYMAYSHLLYFQVINNLTGCSATGSFQLTVEEQPTPVITSQNGSSTLCVDFTTLTTENNVILVAQNTTAYLGNPAPSYTYQWYVNGVVIADANNSTYNVPANPTGAPSTYTVSMATTTAGLFCNATSSSFVIQQSGSPALIGIGYSIVNNSGSQDITVQVEGYGVYQYALDSGPFQSSPTFLNVPLGTHSIYISDLIGCGTLVITNIAVNLTVTPTPTGSSSQNFTSGQTLSDLVVAGQNIQWYAAATGKNSTITSTLLPATTTLVDGTTYYATQKIGGYESTTRLPVTVHLTLKNEEFSIRDLSFSPNPVATILNVKANENLKTISIYNLLGQNVLTKTVNEADVQIDLSLLNSGTYIIKVSSSNNQNTFKIIKK